MKKKRLPKSIRKYLRSKKARIRREVFDIKKQEKQIQELYQKIHAKKLKTEKLAKTNGLNASGVLAKRQAIKK